MVTIASGQSAGGLGVGLVGGGRGGAALLDLLLDRPAFLQKPFTPDMLARKVREVLAGPDPRPSREEVRP